MSLLLRELDSLSSPESFANSCRTVLERMLNTVPSNVQLTDEITLLHAKVINVLMTLEHGELIFKASLRVRDTSIPCPHPLTWWLLAYSTQQHHTEQGQDSSYALVR